MEAGAVLVANRGEIARRIFRTARRLGLRTVAVYSDADAASPYVMEADAAVRIGGAEAADSYLRPDRIVAAARQRGAGIVHPGYGFLAEDPRLARACEEAGLRFVGPPADVLARVGNKAEARLLAEEAGVPVLRGYAGPDQSDGALQRAADALGYPVIVKPALGGGGTGMGVARSPSELPYILEAARRMARASFDDDRLILEELVERARHVEVQVIADSQGMVAHLGERDCSVQRRHQKVIEEAPAPCLADDVRRRLHEAAVTFARAAGYRGAGTCEFVVGDGVVGFIEMNARLQVEHPVTELVLGVDLVELQLRVAMGEALPPVDATPRGHAVEARVYAEDPAAGFLPQSGRVEHVWWPPGVRVDSGIEEGAPVPIHYDPLLAKIVAAGPDRHTTVETLARACADTEILGLRTNLSFLARVLREPVFVSGGVTTGWLDSLGSDLRGEPEDDLWVAAAAAEASRLRRGGHDPWEALGPWRAGGERRTTVVLRWEGSERALAVLGEGSYRVEDRLVERGPRCHTWLVDGEVVAAALGEGTTWFVGRGARTAELAAGPAPRRFAGGAARLDSPLPGRVVAVRIRPGDSVERGRELLVVEAMKMEHSVRAPADGVVRAVLCAPGEQVARGQALVDFDPL